jgi:HD-like signal output (HDOD) protein
MKLVDPIRYVGLKESRRLPSPKGLALAIVRLLQQDDYRLEDLTRLVQSDPVIAGELLRFANAASYGHSNPIVSISKAVTTLGSLRIRVIVIAFSVINNNRRGSCPQFDYEKFWSHALATAISAQALASLVKINIEEHFTAGLLCRLGELALASIFPERYGEIISKSHAGASDRIEMERDAFGIDHRELNSTLLLEWGLPLELVTAIYHSEYPDKEETEVGTRIKAITLSLHVALAFADYCVTVDVAEREMAMQNLYTKASRIGIGQAETDRMAEKIITSWQEWGKFLKIHTNSIG